MTTEFTHELAHQRGGPSPELSTREERLATLVDFLGLNESEIDRVNIHTAPSDLSVLTWYATKNIGKADYTYGESASELIKTYRYDASLENLLIGPSLCLLASAHGDFPEKAGRIIEGLGDKNPELSEALTDLAYPVLRPAHLGNTPSAKGALHTRLLIEAYERSGNFGDVKRRGLLGIIKTSTKVFKGESLLSQDQALEVCDYLVNGEPEPEKTLCTDMRATGALTSAYDTLVAARAVFYTSGPKMTMADRNNLCKLIKGMSSAVVNGKDRLIDSDPSFTKFFKKQSALNRFLAQKIASDPDELGYITPQLELAHSINLRTYAACLLSGYNEAGSEQTKVDSPVDELEIQNKKQEELERQQKELEEQQRIQEKVDSAVQDFKENQEKQIEEWKISHKTIKDLGLQEINHLLVTGTSDEEGNIILDGRTKEEAKLLLGFIVRLKNMSAGELSKELDREQENYSNLKGIKDLLNTDINGSQLIQSLQEPKKIFSMIDDISGSWSAIKEIIESNWPNGEGATIARKIEALLLPAMVLNEEEQVIVRSKETVIEEDENKSNEDIDVQVASESDLSAIADQLDQLILPPKPTQEDIERVVESMPEISDEIRNTIDWNRLRNLALVAEMFDGNLYRAKKEALGGAPAYFVVLFGTDNGFYAIAETPAKGNATYVVAERMAAGSCLEVLDLPKEDAREAGAMRIIHRDSSSSMLKPSERHLQKIIEAVSELETVRELAR